MSGVAAVADILFRRQFSAMKDQHANPFQGRAEDLRRLKPALIADVQLYETADGGKKVAVLPGWGCPCVTTRGKPLLGYDGWPILDEPFEPGETRADVPFFFLNPEGADLMRKLGRFYLWEGRLIGEAFVKAG